MVWLYGILFVSSVVAAAIAGMWLVRRSVTLELLESHTDVAGFIYAVLGVLYGVLLALVVTFAWEQHELAESRIEQEANELGDLFRDAEAFPPQIKTDLRAHIRHYVQTVLTTEWPSMVRDQPSAEAWRSFNRLWSAYVAFTPTTQHEQTWYSETIGDLNEVGNFRRLRLLSSHETVPGALWVILIIGGVITTSFSYFFGTKNSLAQALMVSALSCSIGLTLFLILALNHPFRGLAPVEPAAFQQLLSIFDTWSR